MHERIRVRLSGGGADLPVSSLTAEGVELAFESSARPLGFAVLLAPANAVVRERLTRVRKIEDWAPHEIRLKVTNDNGELVITGGGKRKPATSLPPGRYIFEFALSETKFINARREIEIPAGGEAVVKLDESPSTTQVVLVEPSSWDKDTRAVCEHPESRIDRMDPVGWLRSQQPRKARKACLLNLLAKTRSLPVMRTGESLCASIESIHWADVDRIAVAAKPELLTKLRSLSGWTDTGPIHPSHAANLAKVFGGTASDYKVESFREPASLQSMQLVCAIDSKTGRVVADIDVDLGNPKVDLTGFVFHLGELIDPGRTNHLNLYRNLIGRLGDVLYYRLEEALGQPAS